MLVFLWQCEWAVLDYTNVCPFLDDVLEQGAEMAALCIMTGPSLQDTSSKDTGIVTGVAAPTCEH